MRKKDKKGKWRLIGIEELRHNVCCRLSETEYEKIKAAAEEQGCSIPDVIRTAWRKWYAFIYGASPEK